MIDLNEYRERKQYKSGSYGIIYENDDHTLTKIMRYPTTSPVALIKIKELNLDHFYKIFNIYVDNNGKNDYLVAYDMEKVDEEDINLVTMPIDFIITNLNILINSFKVLSDNFIIVNDLHEDNIIINSNGIYIIDCDKYRCSPKYDKNLIYFSNIEYLKKAIYYHLAKNINMFKRRKLKKLFENYDLEGIINTIKDSKSVYEYLKK